LSRVESIKDWDRCGAKAWIDAAKKEMHHDVLAVALANKLAKRAGPFLNKQCKFQCVTTHAMAYPIA
jgi:hypothetical protein